MKIARTSVVPALALALALTLVAAACGSSAKTGAPSTSNLPAKQGGTITVAAKQEITNFNTNTSVDNSLWGAMITRLIWPEFYYQTPDFKLALGPIADGPATVVKEKPFTVRWKIKKDAVWSDGVPVSSDDLLYYWQSCNGKVDKGEPTDPKDPTATGVDCVATSGYDKVTKFIKVDEKTAEAVFSSPVAEFQSMFSNPMPPAHIARAKGKDAWAKAFVSNPIVSAAPFQLKDYKKGESLTLERNPKFWGTPANLDTITFRFISASGQIVDALRNGEVDLIYPDPQIDLLSQMAQLPGIVSGISFGPSWEQLTFNERNPILADGAVRKAITLGVDRQAIVDRLMKPFSDKAQVLNNRIFMPGTTGFVDNAGDLAARNVDEAKKLLDDDGWKLGTDGVRAKAGKKLSFRIITTGGDALREKTEELLQAQFKDFGATLKIENRPGSAAFDPIFGGPDTAGAWDIALFAWSSTVTPAIDNGSVYGTGQGNNPGGYSDKKVDDLLAQALRELDETKRTDILNQIDKQLWIDLPVIPLYQKPTFLAYSDKYVNIIDNTTSEGFTWNAEKWGLKG